MIYRELWALRRSVGLPPDLSALNPESKYFDPKATPENPRWVCVDVKFVRKLPKTISLQRLKTYEALNGLGTDCQKAIAYRSCRLAPRNGTLF